MEGYDPDAIDVGLLRGPLLLSVRSFLYQFRLANSVSTVLPTYIHWRPQRNENYPGTVSGQEVSVRHQSHDSSHTTKHRLHCCSSKRVFCDVY